MKKPVQVIPAPVFCIARMFPEYIAVEKSIYRFAASSR